MDLAMVRGHLLIDELLLLAGQLGHQSLAGAEPVIAKLFAHDHFVAGEFDLGDRRGPEGGEPLPDDEREQAEDHEHGQPQCAAGEPDPRFALSGQ
jgi:hypothetical protein